MWNPRCNHCAIAAVGIVDAKLLALAPHTRGELGSVGDSLAGGRGAAPWPRCGREVGFKGNVTLPVGGHSERTEIELAFAVAAGIADLVGIEIEVRGGVGHAMEYTWFLKIRLPRIVLPMDMVYMYIREWIR